jgi:hypothetical protein
VGHEGNLFLVGTQAGNDGKGRARGLYHGRVDIGAIEYVAVTIVANFARCAILLVDDGFAKVNLGCGFQRRSDRVGQDSAVGILFGLRGSSSSSRGFIIFEFSAKINAQTRRGLAAIGCFGGAKLKAHLDGGERYFATDQWLGAKAILSTDANGIAKGTLELHAEYNGTLTAHIARQETTDEGADNGQELQMTVALRCRGQRCLAGRSMQCLRAKTATRWSAGHQGPGHQFGRDGHYRGARRRLVR